MDLEMSISSMDKKLTVDGKPYVLHYSVARADLGFENDLSCNQDQGNCDKDVRKKELVQFIALTVDGLKVNSRAVLKNLDQYPTEIQEKISSGAPIEILWCMRHYIAALLS